MRRPLILLVSVCVFVTTIVVGGGALASTRTVTPAKTVTIAITASKCAGGMEFCFKPALLIVQPGTKVVWKDTTVAPHTVTRCDKTNCGVSGGTGTDPKLASPMIKPGRTFAFTFHHLGTYVYYCQVHGYTIMHGAITVRAKVVNSPTTTTASASTTTTPSTTPYTFPPYAMP
jgi:plastocyanin